MDTRPYTVHIYEDEASLISKWTLQYPNTETGGDIFGLWLNENEVVIQAVLGPGRKCRRTATSFFQDEQYLSRVGVFLTINQGLCNVGSWHSHHMMNLPDPSRGDKDTIWRHLPTPGRFLLLIATIEMKTGAPKIQMGFNLFESTSEGNKVIPMKLEILQGQSPIRANEEINRQMLEGAEGHFKRIVDPEPRPESKAERPEVKGLKSELRHDDVTAGFYPGGKSNRQGHRQRHRQPLQQDTTCEGIRPHVRFWPAFTWKSYPLGDGRERIEIYHYGHLLGSCKNCRYLEAEDGQDGNIYVKQTYRQNCLIL